MDEKMKYLLSEWPEDVISKFKYDEVALYSMTPSHIAKKISHKLRRMCGKTASIFDACACVGGDALWFVQMFNTVICCEIDKKRYSYLKRNIKLVAKYSNHIEYNISCVELIKNINYVDIIYFDPPWGGPSYKDAETIDLSLDGKDIAYWIPLFSSKCNSIAIKGPSNLNTKPIINVLHDEGFCTVIDKYKTSKTNYFILLLAQKI